MCSNKFKASIEQFILDALKTNSGNFQHRKTRFPSLSLIASLNFMYNNVKLITSFAYSRIKSVPPFSFSFPSLLGSHKQCMDRLSSNTLEANRRNDSFLSAHITLSSCFIILPIIFTIHFCTPSTFKKSSMCYCLTVSRKQ